MKFKDYTWDKEFEIKGYFSERSDDIVSNCNIQICRRTAYEHRTRLYRFLS